MQIKGLKNLVVLSLGYTNIRGTGLVHLESTPRVSQLSIFGTGSHTKAVHLKGRTQLTSLDLAGLPITDAGLVHLRSPRSLIDLDLSHTRVTLAGLDELQACLPSVRIQHEP